MSTNVDDSRCHTCEQSARSIVFAETAVQRSAAQRARTTKLSHIARADASLAAAKVFLADTRAWLESHQASEHK